MVDFSSLQSIAEFAFSGLEANLFGSVALMVLFIIGVVLIVLMMMNANKFVMGAFIADLFLGLGVYGYTFFSWIGVFGALIVAGLLTQVFIKLFEF